MNLHMTSAMLTAFAYMHRILWQPLTKTAAKRSHVIANGNIYRLMQYRFVFTLKRNQGICSNHKYIYILGDSIRFCLNISKFCNIQNDFHIFILCCPVFYRNRIFNYIMFLHPTILHKTLCCSAFQ